ncbi:MAG: OadG family protein [Pseudomonadota bacterium]
MLSIWLLCPPAALADEPAAVSLRHWEAIAAGQGLSVSLVGMSVVFVGLTVLFLTMLALRAVLDRRTPGPRSVQPPALEESAPTPLDPRIAAVIGVALQLELRRRTCAVVARGGDTQRSPGWLAARGGQWAAQQQAFFRSRR